MTQPPRLGRWLTWTAYLLIGWPVIVLSQFAHSFVQVVSPDLILLALQGQSLFIASWLCLPAAGLLLLSWRKAPGLWLACAFIWLAQILSICYQLKSHHSAPDSSLTLGQSLSIVLHAGIFHAAGLTAFLLGIPRLRDADGLVLPRFMTSLMMEAGAKTNDRQRFLPNWLGIFCCYLLVPLIMPPAMIFLTDRGH